MLFFFKRWDFTFILAVLTLDEGSLKEGVEKLPLPGTPMLKTFDWFDSQSLPQNYQGGERCSSHPHHTFLHFSPLFWHHYTESTLPRAIFIER